MLTQNMLSKLSIRAQFLVVLAVVGAGLLLFGGISWRLQETLRVGGPIYERVVRGKDIIADILPPPRYVLESYLVVLQAQQSSDPNALKGFAERLAQLEKEFQARHEYWSQQPLSEESKQLLLQASDAPARQFFSVAKERFFPQRLAGQDSSATLQQLDTLYQQHRLQIDKLVLRENAALAQEEANASIIVSQGRWQLGATLLAVLVLALLLIRQISQAQRGQTGQLRAAMELVARGNLQQAIIADSDNELGQVSRATEGMRQNLQGLITQVQRAAGTLKQNSHQLYGEADQVRNATMRQVGDIEHMSSQVQTLADTLDQLSAQSEQSASNSGEAISAAQQSVQELATSSEVLSQVVETVRATAALLETLTQRAEEIGGVASTIRDIADQTNLLALNAAIEAARAGESGRGFAVVADEVRKLAERTTQSTGSIGEILGSVQQSTRDAVGSIRQGMQQSEHGLSKVQQATQTLEQMQQSIGQLGDALNHVVEQIRNSQQLRHEVRSELQQVLNSTQNQAQTIAKLHALIQESGAATDSLDAASSHFKL